MAIKRVKKGQPKVKHPPLRDPLTGQFVKYSLANARRIEASVRKAYRAAQSARAKAARKRFGGAKTPKKQREQNRAYYAAAKRAAKLSMKLDQATKQRSATEAKRRRLPRVIEVGITYKARKGPASDVNFNIRISRTDGGGVTESDARRALDALATGNPNEMPRDLRVSAVDWASPSRVDRRGQARTRRDMPSDNVFSFASIISTVIANRDALRIGEVKADRIGL